MSFLIVPTLFLFHWYYQTRVLINQRPRGKCHYSTAGGTNNVIGDSNNFSAIINGSVTYFFWEVHKLLFLDQFEDID